MFAGPPLQKPIVPHGDALAFFPRAVTIHAGDTVTWQILGFHTVTFAGAFRILSSNEACRPPTSARSGP